MPTEIIRIPQLGEGLHEALLVEYLRQPGETVKRDEPLYVMETDKATTEVESSFEGTILEWLVEPGVVLEIGTEIGRVETVVADEKHEEVSTGSAVTQSSESEASENNLTIAAVEQTDDEDASDQPLRRLDSGHALGGLRGPIRRERGGDAVKIPPRTRKHLQALGLLDRVDEIPSASGKLMPEDVDRYVAALGGDLPPDESELARSVPFSSKSRESKFTEQAIPRRQLTLNYRLQRGLHQVVPATAVIEVNWSGLASAREENRGANGPTGFMMMLWCVTKSLARFPKFRSTLVNDGRVLRTFDHIHLGIAVALPDDSLVTAVVPDADLKSPEEFWSTAAERIAAAKEGHDQADENVTFTVSNIGTFGLDMGLPVVVPPAVATMGLGKVSPKAVPDGAGFRFEPTATLALTFDHRIVNGLGAGQFLADLKDEVDGFTWSACRAA